MHSLIIPSSSLIMEQKRAACVYMSINGSNKVGPVDPDPGLDELSQFDNRISKR